MRSRRLYQSGKHIPRGEMWLGHGLFRELGWADDMEARLRLCHDLAMGIIFLPITSSFPHNHLFDYRYFSPDDVSQLVTGRHDLSVGVIIDGPFQRLSQKLGLQNLLRQWLTPQLTEALQEEAIQVSRLISACLADKVDVLVIADDIAYQHSTLVNPSDLEQSLFHFYGDWISQAHNHDIPVLFHSDGKLTDILSPLLACGFDGLAGCQLEYLDLTTLPQPDNFRLVLLAGIPDDFLEKEALGHSHRQQFIGLLTSLTSAGELVLCSSSGLSSVRYLSRLKTLYQWADEAQLGFTAVKRRHHALSD